MKNKSPYRDVCGICKHIHRDLKREKRQAELYPWLAGEEIWKCSVHGIRVEPFDSPNNCCSAACGCTEFDPKQQRKERKHG